VGQRRTGQPNPRGSGVPITAPVRFSRPAQTCRVAFQALVALAIVAVVRKQT
jgi:hypothetical protein